MDIQAIENYIYEKKQIEMPDLQEQFSLTYSDTVKVLSELEKGGKIKYCEGFAYEWKAHKEGTPIASEVYTPKDEQEAFYIKALWECIKSDSASTANIQRKLSAGYAMAARAIDWMEEHEFISETDGNGSREVLLNRQEYVAKFGKPTDYDEFLSEEEERRQFLEQRRRELMERLSHMNDDDEEEDEDDEEEKEDNNIYSCDAEDFDDKLQRMLDSVGSNDSKGDDDDIDKAAQERREYLEKRRQELIERMKREMEEDEEDDKKKRDKTLADLRTEIQQMSGYNAADDTFSIKMEIKYPDGTPFRVKVIEHDGCFYASDLGNTLKYLSSFNDRDTLAKYFTDTLKTDNLCFIEDAVCTTIDDIHDLDGEAAFLFKVVNGLVTQKYFDKYYLGEEYIKLANDILQEEDAAMLVNAISFLDEKRVRVTVLQKQLNIGRPRANQTINTLARLGVLTSDGVKSDKISNGFIAYLKRMLDNKNGE